MKINCDMGEGTQALDALLMPHIDQASIACGGHIGDTQSMRASIELALQHKVEIGAHPSYPDRINFGRSTLEISADALSASLRSQIEQLLDQCVLAGAELRFIKAHGALYNDMVKSPTLFALLAKIAEDLQLPLMLQAMPSPPPHFRSHSPTTPALTPLYEAFADRAYENNGQLVPRNEPGAVLCSPDSVLAQVLLLSRENGLRSIHGQWLDIHADSLCCHSDTPSALASLIVIRRALDAQHA